ncbi:MAG: glycosyltransferase family 4 protein, partial [Armatimonadetes bacterium]|nr:glycosyltransferase family 4 protein [Armatimonadota bacterium]
PNVVATTFSNVVRQFPNAIKVWTEWRQDRDMVQRWNNAFAHNRFYKKRLLFRYWTEVNSGNIPVSSLQNWLVEIFEAALMGDVERMEQLISGRNDMKSLKESFNWICLAAGSAIGRLKRSQPPEKMEDAFKAISSQVLSSIFSDYSKTTPSRSLVYLSFDRNIVSEHAVMTSKFLAKRGWTVLLVHPCGAHWNATPDGVKQLQVGNKGNGIKGVWQIQKEMAQLISRWKPPVIYARQHWQGLLPPLVAKRVGIPYVAEFNGLRHRGILAKQPNSVKGKLIRHLERYCAKWSNAVVVPSLSLAKRIAELIGKTEIHNLTYPTHHALRIMNHAIFVIPNGIDPEVFRPIQQEESRRQLGLPTDGLYVAYTGSLHHWQGVDVLLRAFALLIPKFPNCRLLIVGGQDEPNKESYRYLAHELRIANHVLFVPFVPYEQSALYISAADVCVAPYLPSYCEHGGGSPLKLYAYLSCGRPVVLSDLGEFVDADLVRSNNAGLLVPPNSPEALAEAIATLLGDPILRLEMGKRGREAILNGYTWEHNAIRVEVVMESVMRMHNS